MRVLRALGLYAVLTVLATWPMAANLRVTDAGDSAFFCWVVGWEVHALKTDPASLPHANAFHPMRYVLGIDEPILGTTLLVLPFFPFTDDAVLLHNLARLLTFVFSAFTCYLLARDLRCSEAASLLAGAAFAFSPIRTDQVAHTSTLGTQWLPLVVLFLLRFFRAGRFGDGLLAALAFVLAAYACGYHGVIGLAVLPPAALVLLWGRWRLLPKGLACAALAALALLPLALLHEAALDPIRFTRSATETAMYSAPLEAFLATSSWNLIYGELTGEFRTTPTNNLFPGLVLPSLVLVVGVGCWRRGGRPGREALALVVVAVAAALVALGPEVHCFGVSLGPGPFALLRAAIPLFHKIRVVARAGVYVALPLAVLAARALTLWAPRPALLALVAAGALAETVIAPLPMPQWSKVIDTRKPVPPVYRWLAAQPGAVVVAELPMLDIHGMDVRPAFHDSIYMVRSTQHWKRLVNGYADVEPPVYREVRRTTHRFPSGESLAALRTVGTRYVVLHRGGFGPNQWARIERDLPLYGAELREVARFEDGDRVLELVPPA